MENRSRPGYLTPEGGNTGKRRRRGAKGGAGTGTRAAKASATAASAQDPGGGPQPVPAQGTRAGGPPPAVLEALPVGPAPASDPGPPSKRLRRAARADSGPPTGDPAVGAGQDGTPARHGQ